MRRYWMALGVAALAVTVAGPAQAQLLTHKDVSLVIAGGLPIKAGDEVIGGAGLSGTPGVDEPCVQAGLDKVADRLK